MLFIYLFIDVPRLKCLVEIRTQVHKFYIYSDAHQYNVW